MNPSSCVLPPQLGAVPGEVEPDAPSRPSSTESLPEDVTNFLSKLDIPSFNLQFLTDEELSTACQTFENDLLKSLSLKSKLLSIKSSLNTSNCNSGSKSLNKNPEVSNNSECGKFGSIYFPKQCDKPRDTNTWPLVLHRTYRGFCDTVPVSAFCARLVSVGIRENASDIEFFRYVLANLDMSINVEAINYLSSIGVVDDLHASIRLPSFYKFLKSKFKITDNPSILQSRLEKLTQNSKSVAEFSKEFLECLENLKMSQSSNPLTESYKMSAFRNCLEEHYRHYADEQYNISTLDDLIGALMIWEQHFEARENCLPNSPKVTSVINNVSRSMCPFCCKGFHSEDKCWSKHPELRPPKCEICNRFHNGPCLCNKDQSTIKNEKFKISSDGIIRNSIANCTSRSSPQPWVVTFKKYHCCAVIDSGASISMISVKQATDLLNNFKQVSLLNLKSPILVEFGNCSKTYSFQKLIIPKLFPQKTMEFLIVANLSTPILIGLSDILRFKLINWTIAKSSASSPSHLSHPILNLRSFKLSNFRKKTKSLSLS